MKLTSIAIYLPLILIASCLRPNSQSKLESITSKDQLTGKWLGTIGIGLGSPGWNEVKLLRDVLHKTFLAPQGGSYKMAFDINDGEGRQPSKRQIIDEFSKLADEIRTFRQQNPKAPTMFVLGLTGHGTSQKVEESWVKNNYQYSITSGSSASDPGESFSGRELAELLKSISEAGADEVLVFVQSCHSGAINSDLDALGMSKFISSLPSEAGGGQTFTVITPTNVFYQSPAQIWEDMLSKALDPQGEGDFISYKTFKDRLVKEACSSPFYRPAEAKEGLSGQQLEMVAYAEAQEMEREQQQQQQSSQMQSQQSQMSSEPQDYMSVSDSDAVRYAVNGGLDPQFFEVIDENLPILLTPAGLEKWNNGTLTLPAPSNTKGPVSLSAETIALCDQRKQVLMPMIQQRIQELLQKAPAGNNGQSNDPYTGPYTDPNGDPYTGPYTDPNGDPYTGPYTDPNGDPYAGPYTGPYEDPYTGPYAGPYTGPYTSEYSGYYFGN